MTVFGISTDLPFAVARWIREHDLQTPMISDWDHSIIRAYSVVRDRGPAGLQVARRSIFEVVTEGVIIDRWGRSGANSDFDPLVDRLLAGERRG